MEITKYGKVKKATIKHRPEVAVQTGFSSAATHYAEPSIDLHRELVANPDATFFIRVGGNDMEYFQIFKGDVLLVDRALSPKNGNLLLIVQDGAFHVRRMDSKNKEEEFFLWGVIRYVIHKV